MPTISEQQLSTWTKPAFGNEDEKAKNTEAMIRAAIDASPLLKPLGISVYAKGSYKNNTNVRRDSDVEYTDIVYFDYGAKTSHDEVWRQRGITRYSGPFVDSSGSTEISRFKDAVGQALVGAFGEGAVTRNNKVFTVRESSRSLAADVVPCATHRKHLSPESWWQGVCLLPDRPTHRIVNYPQQHYERGVAKNLATSRRFKSVVRILKNLENQMVADQKSPEVASYLVESLVYNCSDSCFQENSWARQVRNVLLHAWEDTEEQECEQRWMEVNGIKYLFHTNQRWTRQEARDFVHAAWQNVKDS